MSLVDVVNNFQGRKVLVAGDVMLDKYSYGDSTRVSPEAPVLIVKVEREVYIPGGAGNTASNITSLGGKAYLVGVVGKDNEKDVLINALKKRGVNVNGVVVDNSRPTTLKERIVAQNQQVVRRDREVDYCISCDFEGVLLGKIESLISKCDVVVVSDYAKGVITKDLMACIIPLVRSANKYIVIDPRPKNVSLYKGCDVITPNLVEAKAMVGEANVRDVLLNDEGFIGINLCDKLNCNVLLTLGERGMTFFEKIGNEYKESHMHTITKGVHDVTGAGDTVVAAFALALASGAGYVDAAKISNYAAGIVVGKFGTATTTREELIDVIKNYKT